VIPRLALLLSCLALAGCGSSWNPFNWGQTEEVIIRSEGGDAGSPDMLTVPDPRPQMPRVVALSIDRMPTGAILTARGLPPRQGWWGAELVPVPAARAPAGTLAFVFKAVPAPAPQQVGTERSREVVVARTITLGALEGMSRIVVVAGENQMAIRP
jgi:hypothetical protein